MSQVREDPNWPRASAWLANAAGKARLAVIGAPSALGSITPGRCDRAPAAIRAALERYSTWDLETDRDIRDLPVRDFGDLEVANLLPEDAFESIRDGLGGALAQCRAAVLLGGDNSVTRPGVHALGVPLRRCGLVTLDAHFDLRSLEHGLSNGNPVRALLADGLPGERIVQIGIQSFANSPEYARVARGAGIRVVTAEQVGATGLEAHLERAFGLLDSQVDAIYVDLDLDVLDRAFAPATPGSRPGGLAPWQIRRAARVCGAHPKVRVLDLVEVDPERDVNGVTSLAAAACLLSFASGLAGRP